MAHTRRTRPHLGTGSPSVNVADAQKWGTRTARRKEREEGREGKQGCQRPVLLSIVYHLSFTELGTSAHSFSQGDTNTKPSDLVLSTSHRGL